MVSFLPSQLEESLSRREELLGKPHQGIASYPSASSQDNKPTTTASSKGGEIQRGIKLEDPEDPGEAVANIEQAPQINKAQLPNVMANNNEQGGQLSAIPMFTGTRGLMP